MGEHYHISPSANEAAFVALPTPAAAATLAILLTSDSPVAAAAT